MNELSECEINRQILIHRFVDGSFFVDVSYLYFFYIEVCNYFISFSISILSILQDPFKVFVDSWKLQCFCLLVWSCLIIYFRDFILGVEGSLIWDNVRLLFFVWSCFIILFGDFILHVQGSLDEMMRSLIFSVVFAQWLVRYNLFWIRVKVRVWPE